MIQRLLIANRGEIAVRIARTAHRLGLTTVGVYSDVDADAVHADAVDMAVALGGDAPADSYLRADAVLGAARTTGADAIHPGYGFLAENADFAQAVIDAGLIWVGPRPEQIRLLGDKISAKQAAVEAGVPTTDIVAVAPGRIPSRIELPALVKAAAGGGGRGMRIVRAADELADAVEAASREAMSAFGDGTVFVEPYIEHGRHIEVQILGDRHGHVVHLGERECSIQRRNQKIIEEAPSAGIDAEVRSALCDGAIRLARHVGYENAGTVEFMVGTDGRITFLEVNTRLQVEHPVTEAVTGLDLVELQLGVAVGERLPVDQGDVVVAGHAIEARVVAEDPASGWLPSVGDIASFRIGQGVRVDTGVGPGSAVAPSYDSLLAKVIAHGSTRAQAAAKLARALRESHIAGVATNVDTLVNILGEPDFRAAATPTSYLEAHPEVTRAAGLDDGADLALLCAAALAIAEADREANSVTGFAPAGWRNLPTQGQRLVLVAGEVHHVEYSPRGDRFEVLLGPWPSPTDDGSLSDDDRRTHRVRLLGDPGPSRAIEVDGVRHRVATSLEVLPGRGRVVHASSRSRALSFAAPPRFEVPELGRSGGGPVCPLPGTVIAVHVAPGQAVAEGQLLIVVEAMKMEHQIVAAADATVTAVHFAAGERVDQGDLLVSLD